MKMNRKCNEPIIDATHLSTAPIRKPNKRKINGNPVKGGSIFGKPKMNRSSK